MDFFVATSKASALLGEAAVEHGVALTPHFAVAARLTKAPTQTLVTVQAQPTRVATSRAYGPLPRPREPLEGEQW